MLWTVICEFLNRRDKMWLFLVDIKMKLLVYLDHLLLSHETKCLKHHRNIYLYITMYIVDIQEFQLRWREEIK